MKQKLLFIPLLGALLISGVTSCAPSTPTKINLTFGNIATNEAQKINYGDLLAKMDDKESFMIATYESDNTGCTCWTQLKYNMDALAKEKNYLFYQIEWAEFASKDTLGLTVMRDRPCFHFVNKGKVVETYVYSTSKQNPIFKSKSALNDLILEKCNLPSLYLMNAKPTSKKEDSILDKLQTNEEYLVCYYSESCGDCKYVFPNLLYPYVNEHKFNIPMYMVDLDVEGVAYHNGKKDKSNPQYQAYKDEVGLSPVNNLTYGYSQGVVPTFHYYKDGQLLDAAVYFNDKIIKENGQFKVAESFYSKKRQANLHYLDNVETPVLQDKILNDEEVFSNEKFTIWKQDSAAKYHDPLLLAFLNTYAI